MDVESGGLKQQRRAHSTSSGGRHYMDAKDVLSSSSSFSSSSAQPGAAESIRSILVRTGVFRGAQKTSNDTSSPQQQQQQHDNSNGLDYLSLAHKDLVVDPSLMRPNYVSDNVFEAVKLVYELEKFH